MKHLVVCMFWILPCLLWNKALVSFAQTTSPTFRPSYSATTYRSYASTYSFLTSPRPTALCSVSLVENEGTFDTPPLPQPTSVPCSGGKQWMITVSEEHYVEMTLESIDLGLGACFLDTYMIVRDGHSSLSNVLGIFCEQNSKPQNISSSGNKMLVEIVSGWRRIYSYNHNHEAPAFKARYVGMKLQTGDAPQYALLKEEVIVPPTYQDATLWCQAQGAPAPVITWYKDGKLLQNSTSVTYKMSSYAKGGVYKCMANNSFGQTQKNLIVNRQICSYSYKCSCSMLKSRPFWIKVVCRGFALHTVRYAIPRAAKYLSCQYSSLEGSIPVGLFVNWTSLQYLSIQSTSLNNLTKGAFHGLKELKILEINFHTSQQLTIQDGTFDSLYSLEYLDMSNNNLVWLAGNSFRGLTNVRYLKLKYGQLSGLSGSALLQLKSLKELDISMNSLKTLPQGIFRELFQLRVLDLSKNKLSELPDNVFRGLRELKSLDLSNNQIPGLPQSIFKELISLTDLDLSYNQISELPPFIFKELKSLKRLYLNNNEIRELHPAIFDTLFNLEYLYLQQNLLRSLPVDIFQNLRRLKGLKLDSFSLCCYATRVLKNVNCEYPSSARDSFSSCNRMIEASGPRQIIWLLGILAVLGNLAVIAWRLIRRDDHPVQTCLLTNLAVSDFLMGIYLLIIAIKDQIWAGAYFNHDLTWRSGAICKLAGALSVLSSEVSVLMLGVITADRLISIVFTFNCRRLTLKGTYVICAVVWVCATIIAAVPTVDMSYFYNKDRRYGFYGRSSVCLPLQLSPERLAGWEYSVAIFIALNLAAFLFIMAAYIAITLKVYKSQKRINAHGESQTNSTNLKRESALARRVFAIILTDFSCWVPVIILSILALVGKFHDPKGVAYVWFAVFVLPVNSSVNPVLYTFSTPKVRNVLKGWLSRVFQYVRCKARSTSHNISGKDNLGIDEGITDQDDGNTISMTVPVTPPPQKQHNGTTESNLL